MTEHSKGTSCFLCNYINKCKKTIEANLKRSRPKTELHDINTDTHTKAAQTTKIVEELIVKINNILNGYQTV